MSTVNGNSRKSARICVAGCGHWGKNLARNFSELGHLHAICESDATRLGSFHELYPDARPYSQLELALKDPDLDAVVLATPAEEHCRMALAALRAGKDVFVEKPLALEWQEGMEMVETARECGRILMVGHLLKYHPGILKVQELVAQEAFGRIEYIYSNRLSMGKIRREENALWSFAPHDISVILALTGQLPMQVIATGGAYLQPNIADVTISNLLFERGTRCHIFVSWLHPYKEQRLVVIGSKQMVVFEDSRPDKKLLLFDKRIEWKDGVVEAAKAPSIPVAFDPEEPLRRECQHFIDCVTEHRRPNTPGEEGVEVLQVLQACQRSLEMNGEPVRLDPAAAPKLSKMQRI
ncbi:MAG TPA: Gfo/Idh/MocA family oxidoreductase [Bryobacteraceae bacterium]